MGEAQDPERDDAAAPEDSVPPPRKDADAEPAAKSAQEAVAETDDAARADPAEPAPAGARGSQAPTPGPSGSPDAAALSVPIDQRPREVAWGVAIRVVTLAALIGLAIVAWAQFSFRATWVTRFLTDNEMDMPLRMRMLGSLGAGAVAGALTGALLLWRGRRRAGAATEIERWMWFCLPLVLLPALPQLYRWKPWKGRHTELLPVVLAVALIAEVVFVRSLSNVPERVAKGWATFREKAPEFLRRHGPLIAVVVGVVFYISFMSFFNLRWHYKLRTHNFDLAIDNNLIYSALKGAHMQSTVTFGNDPSQYLAIHAKFGQYVILPIYALYPTPETLIVIQSALLGATALPLFGFARHHVRPWIAAAIALAYLAYYPVHSANFCESKYLSLSGFFVVAVFWAAETRRWGWMAAAFVAATMMREDIPIGLAIGGAFLALTGHRPLAGLIMAAVSTVWFLILRLAIMDNAGDWWFPDMYKGLWAPGQKGFVSVAKTLASNPLFVLGKIITRDKLFFLMHLLVPLAFIPLRRWWLWASILPGALLTLLVTDYKPIYGFSFQYVMHWVPYMFLAVPLALAAMERSGGRPRMLGALLALGLAVSVTSYNYGAFSARDGSVKGGYFDIEFGFSAEEKQRLGELREVIGLIPKDASVVATEGIGPHVSSRQGMYALRRGVYDAEFMLASQKELDYEQTRPLFTKSVKEGHYGVLKRVGEFVLLRRGHDTSANADLIRDWKL